MTREQLFRLAETIRHGLLDPSMSVEELAVRVAAEAVRIVEESVESRVRWQAK